MNFEELADEILHTPLQEEVYALSQILKSTEILTVATGPEGPVREMVFNFYKQVFDPRLSSKLADVYCIRLAETLARVNEVRNVIRTTDLDRFILVMEEIGLEPGKMSVESILDLMKAARN